MNYYERSSSEHTDGSRIFQTEHDRRNEAEVIKEIEEKWDCKIGKFGALSPIDCYAVKHGRTVSVLEIKARTHASDKYKTVFLNVRKWLALQLASVGMGVDALYFVKFTDGIWWIPVRQVDGNNHQIAGCLERVKSDNDIEPILDIPISAMRRL